VPLTHYQVSFTSKQALALFVFLLFALAGAYFLGVMTGLAGEEPDRVAASRSGGAESPAQESFPTPVLGVQPGAGPAARMSSPDRSESRSQAPKAPATQGTPQASIVLFDDRAEEENPSPPRAESPGPASQARAAPPRPTPSGGFWVQVLSVTSEREARALGARLATRGYQAAVLPGSAPKKGTVYRVRVGPYETREEAVRAATRLSVEEKAETWIVPAGE